ncbi:unnamed protein product [Bursaphelenchus xylophilus]|uniref:(pine wood nematode) hypothetical protein n=1 Tax=Bursaphelenchus xylophilus TaxID=6326 RepID=A0A1I7RS26_BURXY|nr:unnamed protein product [Bursaphelenchus xylophilus]CAG9123290.1 unnamed protein product [Bursaphelenchus xylophilus]
MAEEGKNQKSFDFLNVLGQISLATFVGTSAFVFGSTSAEFEFKSHVNDTDIDVDAKVPFLVDFYAIVSSIVIAIVQGESLTAFRVFRHDTRLVPTLYRLPLNILALIFSILHLIALINHPTTPNASGFSSFYSWISIILVVGYVIQALFTVYSLCFPRNSTHLKNGFRPAHKVFSNALFVITILQIFIGMSYYTEVLGKCYNKLSCKYQTDVFLNIGMVSLILYGLITSTVSINSHWKVEMTKEF